jgi:hypothetical protein
VAEFETDTHKTKTMDLLGLKQIGSIEEYRRQFQQLVYHIRLYDTSLSSTMLIAQFIMGLKEELRLPVEMQLPDSIAKAAILAAIQERLLDKSQKKPARFLTTRQNNSSSKTDSKSGISPTDMWKARQLREHRRLNGLCFKCGDKYSPGHKCPDVTSEAQVAQVAVINETIGDGGGMLSEDILNALEMHSASTEEDCFLSLNAIAGTQNNKVIHLQALVNNQVLSILVDYGSSHTFLNEAMLLRLACKVTAVPKMTVKVANGDTVFSDRERIFSGGFRWMLRYWILQLMTLS